jgi:hypothetical protein
MSKIGNDFIFETWMMKHGDLLITLLKSSGKNGEFPLRKLRILTGGHL